MSLNFVQGDNAPEIASTLHKEDDPTVVVDLTEATGVRFQMRRADDRRYTVNAVATIDDAPAGKVSYAWGPNDLATPGTFLVQWEVTWAGGRVQTTYRTETATVRRQ
jgi:hypothetical protein